MEEPKLKIKIQKYKLVHKDNNYKHDNVLQLCLQIPMMMLQ
jgi:hypothetical protein